jgi:hypothetical protein
VTGDEAPGTRNRARGLMLASLGMLAFSFTFPATAAALHGFSRYLIGIGRAVGQPVA